ncbi:MAG: hypothetical protein ACREQ5_07310, partial [Candidatus Dormibacteria bacterium]
MFYTYIYFDPSREESIYIGKGSGDRSKYHFERKDKHPFTQRLQFMKKHNIKPVIEQYTMPTEQDAFELEIALIKFYGRKDLGTGPLLNLTNGGENPPKRFGPLPKNWCKHISEGQLALGEKHWTKNPKFRTEASARFANQMWITNGFDEQWLTKNLFIPEGWYRGRKQTTCPHCDKSGGSTLMIRYHYDNCKYKDNPPQREWITDGTKDKCILFRSGIPTGWYKGRSNDSISQLEHHCPHCNKVGRGNIMLTKHFNNCSI